MKVRSWAAAIGAGILSVSWAWTAASDIEIEIVKPGGEKVVLAVPDFMSVTQGARPDLAKDMADILRNDIRLSGCLALVKDQDFVRDVEAMDRRAQTIHFDQWRALGAAGLVKVRMSLEGRALRLEVRLYDLFSGRPRMGKT